MGMARKGIKMETNNTKVSTARSIACTAMFSAVAFVLMYIEVAIPIIPSFIKFDFSDLPALIGAFALGPVYGVIIELVKNLLHLVFSQSMFIGELSNFMLGAVFTFTAGAIYKSKKSKKSAVIGGVTGSVAMGVVSVFTNLLIVYPIYVAVYFGGDESICIGMYQAIAPFLKLDSILSCLLYFNLPFTIVKGLISVIITFLVYKRISPIIKGTASR